MRQYESVRETQGALLDRVVRGNRETAFGKEHGFGTATSIADYRRQVPIRLWGEISPYVDQALRGQHETLIADAPVLYHWTSGTTGTPKMIPFTRNCDAAARLTLKVWLAKALLDNPGLLDGKVFALLNAGVEGYTETNIPCGSVSGNIYFRMPQAMRPAYSNAYDVYHIEDVSARYYALLRFGLNQDCSFLMSGNPAGFSGMFELADKLSEPLIRDIHDGTLSKNFDIPKNVRAAAITDLTPNPARARILARAKETDGRLKPTAYWPGLQVIGCWLGGSMGHFAPSLREWCGDSFRFRDIGYMASEGIFSIPMDNDTPDSLLALHSAFFEFIPEEEFGRSDPTVLLAHELEAGRNYQVVLTTTGGLYRYAINDVIRVAETHNGSPTIRFLYKGGNVQNMQGEMVTVDHVMAALNAVTAEQQITLRHFQVLADLADRRYVLCMEPTEPPPRATLTAMLAGFERELAKQNMNYKDFRELGHLNPPRLRLMRAGWFARIMADHLARGRSEAQFKPFVLVDAAQHTDMTETEISLDG